MKGKKHLKQLAIAAVLMVISSSAFAIRHDGNCRTYIGSGGYYVIYNSDGVAIGSGWDPDGYTTGSGSC